MGLSLRPASRSSELSSPSAADHSGAGASVTPDSGSGRYMILRLRDCTQCTALTSVTIHGPSVQLTFIISQTDIDSETDILHSSSDSDPCQCQTYY